jgi:hypothetical protein
LSFTLTYLFSAVLWAFSVNMSIANTGITGLYIYYGTQLQFLNALPSFAGIILSLTGIPIAMRGIYVDRFAQELFHSSNFSYPVTIAAALWWLAFISVVFCLPELNLANFQSLDHTPVASGSSTHRPYACP